MFLSGNSLSARGRGWGWGGFKRNVLKSREITTPPFPPLVRPGGSRQASRGRREPGGFGKETRMFQDLKCPPRSRPFGEKNLTAEVAEHAERETGILEWWNVGILVNQLHYHHSITPFLFFCLNYEVDFFLLLGGRRDFYFFQFRVGPGQSIDFSVDTSSKKAFPCVKTSFWGPKSAS